MWMHKHKYKISEPEKTATMGKGKQQVKTLRDGWGKICNSLLPDQKNEETDSM